MSYEIAIPRILFLTPFNFLAPEHDNEFDALVQSQLGPAEGVSVVASHVGRFEADDQSYEAVQSDTILGSIQQAQADGYDAVIIACYYDPALEIARETASIPVIGPLQLTTALALQYGPKFAVITDVEEAEPVIGALIERYGLGHANTGVTSIGLDGDAILTDTRAAAEKVDLLVREVAAKGEAQSVVIGCTIVSAAYEQHRDDFSDYGVRVLNSNQLTLQGAVILS